MLITDPDAGSAVLDNAWPLLADSDRTNLAAMRVAVRRFRALGDPAELERGFAAAHELIAALGGADGSGAAGHPDLGRLHRLADVVEEFGDLLDAAADEAGRSVAAACTRLWDSLGLRSAPVGLTEVEHDAARMVFACACAPAPGAGSDRLRASLRRLPSARVARLLCGELCAHESVWLQAVGDRYGSLRHRCAPRTALRSRGLSDLLRGDEVCRAAVTERLERWVADGLRDDLLAAELEAAIVHTRTPSRLA